MTPDSPYCTPVSQRLEALVGLGLDGLPLTKPPWGRITAIDLNRGTHAWQVANGRGLREHPALLGLDLPPLGVASRPVALVTATLLFIGEGGNVFGGIQPNMWDGRSAPTTRRPGTCS